ncbi:metallothionein [Mycobacterium sp. M1]|uniref:Metallothionein n=1 Tax=Mycolicibacter acidiphilus TaxID=2835306 RepID=A0ABS5RGF3_9MYCO|nr:metallothionein [Mycolicibacter acidiphilus]MBS9533249.1 metallothionein [Mycolicibacter acidiphilus]
MGINESGTLLTCTHADCGCRVRIEVPCGCDGASDAYRCGCGADLVAVS